MASFDYDVVVSQCHGSWFDMTTGAVISGPATDRFAEVGRAPGRRDRTRAASLLR